MPVPVIKRSRNLSPALSPVGTRDQSGWTVTSSSGVPLTWTIMRAPASRLHADPSKARASFGIDQPVTLPESMFAEAVM